MTEASVFRCINLMKPFEGFSPTPYYCPAGILTIGYGRTHGVKAGDVTTEEAEELWMVDELMRLQKLILSWVRVPLSSNQIAALLSFVYNVGTGAFEDSTLLKKLNTDNYFGAVNEFPRWNKGGGKVLPGLVRRRAAEANLFCKP